MTIGQLAESFATWAFGAVGAVAPSVLLPRVAADDQEAIAVISERLGCEAVESVA
jgi:hypothetical protein